MSEDVLKEYWDKKTELDHWLLHMAEPDRYGNFDIVSLVDDLKEHNKIIIFSIIKKRIKMDEEYEKERYIEEHKYEIHLSDVIQHLVSNGINHY